MRVESASRNSKQRLAVIRALYFFLFAGNGIFFTYINVYYRSIGLSGVQIGLINTLAPLIGIFGSTLWGLLSDRFGRTRLLLGIAAAGAAIGALGISAVQTFIWILPLAAVSSLFANTLGPLVDSVNFAALGEQRERYSRQRIFGTVGFILTSSTVGLLFERTGLRFMFILYPLTLGLFILMLSGLKAQSVHLNRSLFSGVQAFLRQPAWVVFTLSVIVQFIGNNGFINFLSITLYEMGASDWLVGFAWSAAAISELPVMFFGAWMIRRWGASRLVPVAMAFYLLRIFLYAVMPNPAWALGVNLLHSVTYGVFWIAGVTYAYELAPAEYKATSQGLFVASINLAAVIGSPLSGWLYDNVGRSGMFLTQVGFSFAALVLFLIGRRLLIRRAS